MLNSVPQAGTSLAALSRSFGGSAREALAGPPDRDDAQRVIEGVSPASAADRRAARSAQTSPDPASQGITGHPHEDIETRVLDALAEKHEVQSQVAVIRAQDEALGSLLDVFA